MITYTHYPINGQTRSRVTVKMLGMFIYFACELSSQDCAGSTWSVTTLTNPLPSQYCPEMTIYAPYVIDSKDNTGGYIGVGADGSIAVIRRHNPITSSASNNLQSWLFSIHQLIL